MFQVSSFRFQVPGFRFQVPGFKLKPVRKQIATSFSLTLAMPSGILHLSLFTYHSISCFSSHSLKLSKVWQSSILTLPAFVRQRAVR